MGYSSRRAPLPPEPPKVDAEGAVQLVEELRGLLEAFAHDYPQTETWNAVNNAINKVANQVRDAKAVVVQARKQLEFEAAEKERRCLENLQKAKEADEDRRAEEYLAMLAEAQDVWTEERMAEEMGIHRALLNVANNEGLFEAIPVPPAFADLERAWDNASIPYYEPREPFTEEERAQIIKAAEKEHLTSEEAAAELGVSVSTFAKYKKKAKIRPADDYVTYAGYVGYKYDLADVVSLHALMNPRALAAQEKKRKDRAKRLQELWAALNPRQRQYLLVAYRRFVEVESYRSDAGFDKKAWDTRYSNWPDEPAGWRWVYHDAEKGSSALANYLRPLNLLDSGAGSTYEALDQRGLLKRRWEWFTVYNLMGQSRDISVLWVNLTTDGRALARVALAEPERFPVETPEPIKPKPKRAKAKAAVSGKTELAE